MCVRVSVCVYLTEIMLSIELAAGRTLRYRNAFNNNIILWFSEISLVFSLLIFCKKDVENKTASSFHTESASTDFISGKSDRLCNLS